MSPSQAGATGALPGTGVIGVPHASTTIGGVGGTASTGQATVDDPSGSEIVKAGISIV